MKKMITAAIIVLTLGCLLIEKTNAQQYNGFGLTIGTGVRVLKHPDEYSKLTNTPGISYRVGFISSFKFSEQLSIEPELVYSLRGYDEEAFNFDFGIDWFGYGTPEYYKLNMHYVDLALPVKIRLKRSWKIFLGPQFGYLLSAKYIIDADTRRISNVTDYFKSFDFGFVYGSEIAFKSGWGIQALFNSGVLSVDKGDHWGKNFLATAGGYYRFPAKNTK